MRWSPEQARRRFGRSRVARLATVAADGRPHLVPVAFALDGDTVAIAVDNKPKTTRSLKRLANIEADPRVCLLADEYGEDWADLWWVRADGEADIHHDGPLFDAALTRLCARYPQYRADPPRGPVILVRVTRWSGWSAHGPR
ncbi:PPOX class probable F420-dependent enzyme [Spinactinospora alkalitolerans]|uniref:PPOX class probable F420-dependent enzyme n=1 Tax=Spinactinospora alkalitolerans TaxID=687207 RepID=A0A852U238_9ACTN|nr:TIGR03668 family PPOX class F420-dependent oxidoreductase [Spinactinospora alkalitolerans]NYE50259.1 PPOX class probable F420-dependent enzyme [Spinactinospora alkalitolerans]